MTILLLLLLHYFRLCKTRGLRLTAKRLYMCVGTYLEKHTRTTVRYPPVHARTRNIYIPFAMNTHGPTFEIPEVILPSFFYSIRSDHFDDIIVIIISETYNPSYNNNNNTTIMIILGSWVVKYLSD